MCEGGSKYKACASPCQPTCYSNLGIEEEAYCANAQCIEGCFCDDGLVMEGTAFNDAN